MKHLKTFEDVKPFDFQEDWEENIPNKYIVIKKQRVGEDEDYGWSYFIAQDSGKDYIVYYGDNFEYKWVYRKWEFRKSYEKDDRNKMENINDRDALKLLMGKNLIDGVRNIIVRYHVPPRSNVPSHFQKVGKLVKVKDIENIEIRDFVINYLETFITPEISNLMS